MISADVRRAAWDAARAAAAAGELPPDMPPADASTLRPVPPSRGGGPGRYASTLPYLLAAGEAPPQVAAVLAGRLARLPWVAAATAQGGHLVVTVTAEALAAVAVRTAQAPDCARSDILHGLRAPAPPPADLARAPGWAEAHAWLTAEVTARLAAKAGAEIFPERLPPGPSHAPATITPAPTRLPPGPSPAPATITPAPTRQPPGPSPAPAADAPDSRRPGPGLAPAAAADTANHQWPAPPSADAAAGAGSVVAALRYAGSDAVRYAVLRRVQGWPRGATADVPVRYHLDNPVYAVRYAHAHAASVLRQAADLGLGTGPAAGFAPCLLTHPAERALLDALSWLPERVAWAARSGRPGEFARYLEQLAGTYQDCREACPALPFGGHAAPRDQRAAGTRLWLVAATAAAIAAGLGLLGVSAPDRL